MNTSSSELIERAISEAKSGNKAEARKILAEVVRQEPDNARAWYLLSRVLEDKKQIAYCLNQVQRIKPDNAQARAPLQKPQGEQLSKPRSPIKTKQKIGVGKIIAIVSGSILGCCLLITGVSFGLDSLGLLPTSTPTSKESLLLITPESRASTVEVSTETPILPPTETQTTLPINTQTSTSTFTPGPTETVILDTPAFSFDLAKCIPINTTRQKGTVVGITDGDTIDVRFEDGNIYPVRYIGINTPETNRPFYQEATQANSELVNQKEVIMIKDVSEIDMYDRLLRYIIVGEVFVNYELVRLGFAQASSYPPDVSCDVSFSEAQRQAAETQSGLWAPTQIPDPSGPNIVIVYVNKVAEYVDIQNAGNIDVNLTGWTLVSERGNQSCNLGGILDIGETLRIWAGGSQEGGYGCGYSSNIWNNSESDPAVLYNPQGEEVSRK